MPTSSRMTLLWLGTQMLVFLEPLLKNIPSESPLISKGAIQVITELSLHIFLPVEIFLSLCFKSLQRWEISQIASLSTFFPRWSPGCDLGFLAEGKEPIGGFWLSESRSWFSESFLISKGLAQDLAPLASNRTIACHTHTHQKDRLQFEYVHWDSESKIGV